MEAVNAIFNILCTGVFLVALFACVLVYSSRVLKSQGISQGVYLSFIFILQIFIALLFLWAIPIPFVKLIKYPETEPFVRWAFVSISVLIYFYLRPHSEKRGFFTAFYHLAIISLGWVINRWLGLIFFTLPLLGIFYYVLHLISHSIIPASNPEDKAERHQRFLIFLSYVWGVQMPMWNVVTTNNYQTADKKIDGKSSSNMFPGKSNNRRSLFPGLIHTDSHQVAGILRGADFRVEGPGVIFTDGEDTPFEIVDLRNKAKKNEKEKPIHAFSQEGIPITAEVSVAFRIDRDEAQQVQVHQVGQVNTPPRKVKENHRDVPSLTFPYSKDKVEKALRLRSRQFKANNETTTERWEDQVLQTAEQAAREVLATRKVKDLWQARENPHSDASAEIAASIKGLIETPLRKNGIQIFSAKASGFKFTNAGEKDDEVIAQQIQTWGVERKRELELLLANTQSKIDRIEQDARVNAQSILLSAIMEGLEHARQHHQGADQEAIARVYLDALRDMIEQQADSHHESEAISALKKAEAEYFKNNG